MIKFENVIQEYKGNVVVEIESFEIKCGEFLVLVGSSGSGKTTTIKMINRLIEPTKGKILIQDRNILDTPVRDLRLDIGYVLQQIALFPNLTVKENIELIPEMKGWKKEKRLEKIIELLNRVGLDPDKYLNRYPKELSGGEQQRIGILRAIIAEPKVLLMDEPFSALDPISRSNLQEMIKKLHSDLKMTIVFVTHDMNEAMILADRIAIMSEGKILQAGTPCEIKKNPVNNFVIKMFDGLDCEVKL
ncbi:ABC transporter ATP-binding protein [Pseudostreptobacillus hongkongensis]|uniref:ABC transporter ATP-binding protein n=1 Tax=Pseudostreptobacillus hongkongensis TaxID=1162717 RepID=UPI0028D5AE33|nr:ABC transporter ATP-binding protein [Pseudostreptobacillus hongkongensis]